MPSLCFFPIQQLPCYNDILNNKGLNLFDNCAAECVHLCPQNDCTLANCKKMDVKISKNLKIKSSNFWQYYFFLESYTIEVIDNDDSTHESNYIRNYMRPSFM